MSSSLAADVADTVAAEGISLFKTDSHETELIQSTTGVLLVSQSWLHRSLLQALIHVQVQCTT
jgi:hypothetical protein